MSNQTRTITAKELFESSPHVNNPVEANTLLNVLARAGAIEKKGQRPNPPKTRGKKSNEFIVSTSVSIEDLFDPSIVDELQAKNPVLQVPSETTENVQETETETETA